MNHLDHLDAEQGKHADTAVTGPQPNDDNVTRETKLVMAVVLWLMAISVACSTWVLVGGFTAANYICGCFTGWMMCLLVTRLSKSNHDSGNGPNNAVSTQEMTK